MCARDPVSVTFHIRYVFLPTKNRWTSSCNMGFQETAIWGSPFSRGFLAGFFRTKKTGASKGFGVFGFSPEGLLLMPVRMLGMARWLVLLTFCQHSWGCLGGERTWRKPLTPIKSLRCVYSCIYIYIYLSRCVYIYIHINFNQCISKIYINCYTFNLAKVNYSNFT